MVGYFVTVRAIIIMKISLTKTPPFGAVFMGWHRTCLSAGSDDVGTKVMIEEGKISFY